MAIRFHGAGVKFDPARSQYDFVIDGDELAGLEDVSVQFIERRTRKYADAGQWASVPRKYALSPLSDSSIERIRAALPDDGIGPMLADHASSVAAVVTVGVRLGGQLDHRSSPPLALDGSGEVAGSDSPIGHRNGWKRLRFGVASAVVLVCGVVASHQLWHHLAAPVFVETIEVTTPVDRVQPPTVPIGSDQTVTPDDAAPTVGGALYALRGGNSGLGLDMLRALSEEGNSEACYFLARLYDPVHRELDIRPADIEPDLEVAYRYYYHSCSRDDDIVLALERLRRWTESKASEGDSQAIALLPILRQQLGN